MISCSRERPRVWARQSAIGCFGSALRGQLAASTLAGRRKARGCRTASSSSSCGAQEHRSMFRPLEGSRLGSLLGPSTLPDRRGAATGESGRQTAVRAMFEGPPHQARRLRGGRGPAAALRRRAPAAPAAPEGPGDDLAADATRPPVSGGVPRHPGTPRICAGTDLSVTWGQTDASANR